MVVIENLNYIENIKIEIISKNYLETQKCSVVYYFSFWFYIGIFFFNIKVIIYIYIKQNLYTLFHVYIFIMYV